MSDDASQQLEPSDSDLLLSAKAEIDQLRRANEILAAKVDTMDLFKAMLIARVDHAKSMGMGVDVAYSLERRATALRVQGRMGGAVDYPFESSGAAASAYPGPQPIRPRPAGGADV